MAAQTLLTLWSRTRANGGRGFSQTFPAALVEGVPLKAAVELQSSQFQHGWNLVPAEGCSIFPGRYWQSVSV